MNDACLATNASELHTESGSWSGSGGDQESERPQMHSQKLKQFYGGQKQRGAQNDES